MESQAGGVKRSLPGGVRRGPRDSLVAAVPAPVCHRVRLSRRLADENVSRAVKAEVVLTVYRQHHWSDPWIGQVAKNA